MLTTITIFLVGAVCGAGICVRWAWHRYGQRIPPERRIAERRDWREEHKP